MMKKFSGYVEALFDIIYLSVAIVIGCFLLGKESVSGLPALAGQMALVLAFGDAFHLVPRVASVVQPAPDRYGSALGFGKAVTSVTMTVFYVILWQIGILYYNVSHPVWSGIFVLLAVIRIALCMAPQNDWLSAQPSVRWGLFRNIPFFIMGIMAVVFFFYYRTAGSPLSWMGPAILLSFAFYAPVVLWSQRYPKVGMCMLPKTCMYVWALWMCLGLS